jgi:hypothetical protein
LYGLCIFGFGGIDETSAGFFHQPNHQFGACLWDSVGSIDFWRKRKNDPTVLLGYRNHFGIGVDLSGAQLLAQKEKRHIDSQSLIFTSAALKVGIQTQNTSLASLGVWALGRISQKRLSPNPTWQHNMLQLGRG